MGAASNTFECFRLCVGKQIIGVLRDALPVARKDLSRGTKTLIFDDGTGLTISSKGTFWLESAGEIDRAVSIVRRELETTELDLREVLALAGAAS